MQAKQGKRVLSTSNVLFGMNHFMKFCNQLNSIHKLGLSYPCADNILRWIYFIILIISADYEEQCVLHKYLSLAGSNGREI